MKKSLRESNYKYRTILMKFCNGTIYIALAALFVYEIYRIWNNTSILAIQSIIGKVIFSIIFGIGAILLFLCNQETHDDDEKTAEKDSNTTLSLIAVVLAIIALVK